MKRSWMEPAYEAARTWALQPISHPPAGWAQIVRRGIASLAVQGLPHPPTIPSPRPAQTSSPESGLLTSVAAMIAEVCP
jgi:hypothetical protein